MLENVKALLARMREDCRYFHNEACYCDELSAAIYEDEKALEDKNV